MSYTVTLEEARRIRELTESTARVLAEARCTRDGYGDPNPTEEERTKAHSEAEEYVLRVSGRLVYEGGSRP